MNQKSLVIIYWNLGIGGIQKRIRDLVAEIIKNRSNWSIIILVRKTAQDSFQSQFEHIERVTIQTYPFSTRRIRPIGGFFFWLLYKYIQIQPAVCLTFLPMLGVALCVIHRIIFWNKTKLILNEGVFISDYLRIHKLEWLRPFVKLLYNFADSIIVPTLACKEDLVSSFAIQSSRIVTLPNWTLIKKHAPLLRTKYDLIYVGRFDPEKNVMSICDMVAEILKYHSHIRVLMVGSGDMLTHLHARIKELHLAQNIQIEKFSVQAPTRIRNSKILILPSLNEGMPNVVLEAAMMSVPAVISNFKGAREVVVHGKTGFVANETSQMIRYINELLQYPQKRLLLGKGAQEFVNNRFTQRAQQNFIDTLIE